MSSLGENWNVSLIALRRAVIIKMCIKLTRCLPQTRLCMQEDSLHCQMFDPKRYAPIPAMSIVAYWHIFWCIATMISDDPCQNTCGWVCHDRFDSLGFGMTYLRASNFRQNFSQQINSHDSGINKKMLFCKN